MNPPSRRWKRLGESPFGMRGDSRVLRGFAKKRKHLILASKRGK